MANALKKLGEAALKPVLRDGSWLKPKVSARIAADLKKEALVAGRQEPLKFFKRVHILLSLMCITKTRNQVKATPEQ